MSNQHTTKGFAIRSNPAANSIASRYDRASGQPDPAPEPSYQDDLITRINAEQNISLNDGPVLTIDVQPDYRYVLITIIYHVTRIYAVLDQRNNPLITPSSLTAYCLAIVYAFALISDSENIRLTKSNHADQFADNPQRRDLLIELERAYVPSFLKNILTGLTPAYDPRRPNIAFINSLACFSLTHDFGKSFPISMFFKAHNIVATRPTNLNPSTVYNDWLQMQLVTGTPNLYIAQLLGANLSLGTYANWVSDRVQTLFNPVTSRSNTARPTFSPIATFPFESTTWGINPYIYLLNADKDNIYTTLSFVKSMSEIISEQIPGSIQLGSMFSNFSGLQILTHFYHGPALPTWHYCIPKPTENGNEISSTNFATTIHFLQQPTAKADVTLKYPTDDSVIDKILYLVHASKKHDENKEPDDFIDFDTTKHVHPDVRYFDPYEYTPSKLAFTVMTGLSIETEEIDGFSIPQPNPGISLYDENSFALQSAVPLKSIKKASTIGNADVLITLASRPFISSQHSKIGLSLYDLSSNRLPIFDQQVREPIPTTGLYGFDALTHVGFFTRAFNYLGYRLASIDESYPPNIPNEQLYGWSSYRYLNSNVRRNVAMFERTYMLFNLRTIYGTNVTMAQSVHPSLLIPKA
jgi:hypothetical protein